jgi:hypothetical protein
MLDRVLRGIAWGAALAACACSPDDEAGATDAGRPRLPPLSSLGCHDGVCLSVECYQPDEGADCVDVREGDEDAAADVDLRIVTDNCVTTVSGPYEGWRESYTTSAGECCYVVRDADCGEGRPLVVAGAIRRSAAVSRGDWT